jgi:N-glycosylase/DNA lyase
VNRVNGKPGEFGELTADYSLVKTRIEERLGAFDRIWAEGNDADIFYELVFCILTPQSKPALCWEAVKRLKNANLFSRPFLSGKEILPFLYGVRFKYKKSDFVLEAKESFKNRGIKKHLSGFPNLDETRKWLFQNVKGIGIKEAGHFLRNIGIGGELAILDRHVLRFLETSGVIDKIPSSLTENRYLEIERKMRLFADKIGIGMSHLDFLLFYRATKMIFK